MKKNLFSIISLASILIAVSFVLSGCGLSLNQEVQEKNNDGFLPNQSQNTTPPQEEAPIDSSSAVSEELDIDNDIKELDAGIGSDIGADLNAADLADDQLGL